MNYKVIKIENLKNIKQYKWFRTFPNPCYGFNVKMDVTNLVKHSKENKQSFFINALFLVTSALNCVEEFRIREVDSQIRLYDLINPSFIVMTSSGVFENVDFEMVNDYRLFYERASSLIEETKKHTTVKEEFNSSKLFNEFYITCIPWLSLESMSHPLIDNDYASLSCPRICWDKYREENGKIVMILNVTVNHCFVDGFALAKAFNLIQEYFTNLDIINK